MKWITLVFVSGPLLFVLYQVLKKGLFKKKNILINAGLASIIALIVSFYPYYQQAYWIFQYFYGHRVGGPMWLIVPEQERNPLSSFSLTFYLNSFAQLGIFYFILIIVGVFLAFKRKSNLKPILLAVIVSYLFSAYALLKADRHIIPIYPYLAILSASVFDYIKNYKFKTLLVIFAIVLSITSFLGSVWGKGPMKQSLASLPIELPFGQMKRIYLTTYSRPPYIYKISGKEVLDYIANDSKKLGIKNPQVTKLFYYRPLDEPLMTYNLYNYEKPLEISDYLGTILQDPDKEAPVLLANLFKNSDYILMKSGQKTDTYFAPISYQTLKALISLFDNYINIEDYYVLQAKIWINQDSSEVTVFKKNKEISKQEAEFLTLKLSEILKREKSE